MTYRYSHERTTGIRYTLLLWKMSFVVATKKESVSLGVIFNLTPTTIAFATLSSAIYEQQIQLCFNQHDQPLGTNPVAPIDT